MEIKNNSAALDEQRINLQVQFFAFLLSLGKFNNRDIEAFKCYGAAFQNTFEEPDLDCQLDDLASRRLEGLKGYLKTFPVELKVLYQEAECLLKSYLLESGVITDPREFFSKNYDGRMLLFLLAGLQELQRLLIPKKKAPVKECDPEISITQAETSASALFAL